MSDNVISQEEQEKIKGMIDDLVEKAKIASKEYLKLDQEAVDRIVKAMAMAGIAGVTPVTNPTSTTMFKSIISAKTRNVIIFGFHPSAQKCSVRAAEILRDAAVKAGAPENCILWIEEPSITATKLLMSHPDVNLILATGGTSMVKSAYSCGKPALGVGPGNVPCYANKTISY